VAREYATLASVKGIRRIPLADTADDAALMRTIAAASRAIDDVTGRRFWLDGVPSSRTGATAGRVAPDRGDGDGERLLVPDIGSESDLVVELGDGSTWTVVTDYFTEPDGAILDGRAITALLRDRRGWRDDRRWRITARWGWPAIPEPIREATELLASRRVTRRDSPEGVAGWGGESPIRISRHDSDVTDLISRYMLPGFA
jgi:hypothetical protein